MCLKHPTITMIKKDANKMNAIKAFTTYWIKDPAVYCNNCNTDFDAKKLQCCENPALGTNLSHSLNVVNDNKELSKIQYNKHASNKTNTMRQSLRLPPRLYRDLEGYFQEHYQEKLFNSNKELHEFMREFKQFTICETV